jgi:hypothetical protein
MGKKIGLVRVCSFDHLSGDLLYLFTHSGLLANWGAIILPSFVLGVLWKLLIKDNLEAVSDTFWLSSWD